MSAISIGSTGFAIALQADLGSMKRRRAYAKGGILPALNRDIWDVVYCKLDLLDAARLATVDKMTSVSFKRRWYVEQSRLLSDAETYIPLPLIHGMFHVVRCGLQKTHLAQPQMPRQVFHGPMSYSVRQADSGHSCSVQSLLLVTRCAFRLTTITGGAVMSPSCAS